VIFVPYVGLFLLAANLRHAFSARHLVRFLLVLKMLREREREADDPSRVSRHHGWDTFAAHAFERHSSTFCG
jgi:hypothetical protein